MSFVKKFLSTGSERSIQYKKNALYMLLLKGVSLTISLVYVPLLLNTLNTENYGIWLTLTSIVAWVAMLDIGLGNGLRNKLAEAVANEDYIQARKYVSSAYIALGSYIAIFLIVFCLIASWLIPWNTILNAPTIDSEDLNMLVVIVFISFGTQFILNLLNSILLALQLPALSSLITTIGQVLSLIGVLLCVKLFNITSLLVLGTIVSLSPVVVLLLFSIILFWGKFKYLSPSIKLYDKGLINEILKLGLNFFIIQIMTIVLYQSNNLVITHLVGNEAVVEYNIAYKYIQVLHLLYMIIVTPMWSATTQAYVKKDYQWIVKTNRNLNKIALVFSLMGGIMVVVSPFVYSFWLQNENVTILYSTTIIILLTEIFRMYYGNYGYIINGTGKLYAQLIISIFSAVVYIVLMILLGRLWGLTGILIVGLLLNIFNVCWSKYQFNVLMGDRPSKFWNR